MNPLNRRRSTVVAAFLLGLALLAPAWAADDTRSDSKALDHYVYTSLRFVINHGVDLYNAGRVEECYEHFRQSLKDLVPVLSAHAKLQAEIKDGLDKVEKDPKWRAEMAARATMPNPDTAPELRVKAFALRAIFNDVRTNLAGGTTTKPLLKAGTLWDRLGGEKGVRKIVDDFAVMVSADPKVDITRGGKRKLDDLTVADLKQKTVELISEKTGGPFKYTGKSLKDAHKGMGITNEEFDAAADDFKKALTKNNVKPEDGDVLLRFIETTRKDVVEGKKSEEKPAVDAGTVKGRVTIDGKPLARGTVTLVDKDGKAHAANIAADGTYAMSNLPPGTYKVSVTGDGVAAKFGDVNTSGLTSTVEKGESVKDLALQGAK
jgi:hemoglobin